MKTFPTVIIFSFAVGSSSAQQSADTPEQIAYFEKHIRPALVEHCYKCHAAEATRVKGGLLLDTKESSLLGGESGKPGIVPGNPMASTIYSAITWDDPDMQMPPKNRLPAEVVAHFKTWIENGATDPRASTVANPEGGKRSINMAEGRKHWAFQKPVAHPVPEVRIQQWARTDIDKFVLASMESAGLRPVRDADRPTLIRRIAFDLTGLPPTPDEIHAFVADASPDALARVIDMYLDSPRFGERWARHWLDIARYAETNGKETNFPYPHAWRYRDYVIDSFNRDKPYDQFLKEQVAGDLLVFDGAKDQAEKIIATGFLSLGAKGLNTRDRRQFAMDLVDEQIDTLSQSMLGLTLACARCHDHKFDPVTQNDYYALAGIFLSSETLYGTHAQQQNAHPSSLIELDPAAAQPASLAPLAKAEIERLQTQVKEADERAKEVTRQILEQRREAGANGQNNVLSFVRARAARDQVSTLEADLHLFQDDGTPRTLAMGVLDRARPVNASLLLRGEVSQPAGEVPRGLIEVLCAEGEPRNISEGSGRLDLAWFIASKDNPLTARVMVNRIWMKLLGQGIVATPDNFGVMGVAPTDPELLDHLAVSFMESDWSVKKLIRSIMLSRVYQVGSTHDAANYAIDPDNKHRWRMDERRLDAEAIRDAMLAVAGKLDLYPPDGSPVARVSEGRQGILQLLRGSGGQSSPYRSIYLPVVRDQIDEFLSVFDFPDASLVSGTRDTTNVPSQSLFLMNHPQSIALADAFAERVAAAHPKALDRYSHAFELALSRKPSEPEIGAIRSFIFDFTNKIKTGSNPSTTQGKEKAETAALAAFCQALFASAEFRYLN